MYFSSFPEKSQMKWTYDEKSSRSEDENGGKRNYRSRTYALLRIVVMLLLLELRPLR